MADREVDVVVVGAGVAGAAVALAAHRGGAEVLVLEKQTPERHTPNVRMSGGWVMTFTDAAGGRDYLAGCSGGIVDEALFEPWAERAVHVEKWLEDLGVSLELADPETWGLSRGRGGAPTWAEFPNVAGSSSVRAGQAYTTLPAPFAGAGHQMKATGKVTAGEAIYRGLMHALLKEEIEISWGTAPTTLIQDAGTPGRVRGVDVGGSQILARRGVVLAAGGFGANPEMIRQFLSVPNTKFYGNPGNDGSGIKLAMSAGADLVHMNRMVGRGIAAFTLEDGQEMGFMVILHGGGYVLCDQSGNRYWDEYDLAQQSHAFYYQMEQFDQDRVGYTRSPSYLIFDERRRSAGPITYHDRGASAFGIYDWSMDNRAEIDAGWIASGTTPGAAAEAAGIADGRAVDAAVAAYNDAIAAGTTDPVGRPPETMIPLDQPPYYCLPLYCGGPYTTGGPRRDVLGRVLHVTGEPIPGLFSAGEMGQAVGLLYPTSGASITEAICLGEITGEYLAGTQR
ncbi:FAD-dependent oxidoreductase [Mycobacterium sp. C31M]